MANFNIERLEGRGITAEVISPGKVYATYKDFAVAAGYPDAIVDYMSGETSAKSTRASALQGATVKILAKGKHGDNVTTLYVVEAESGERFLFGAAGLKINEAVVMGGIIEQMQAKIDELQTQVDRLKNRVGLLESARKAGEVELPVSPQK